MRRRIVIVIIAIIFLLAAGLFAISPLTFGTGTYIAADTPLILMDQGPSEPIVMGGGDWNYGTGDRVLILHDGSMMLSYPAQIGVIFCIRLKKGEISDVPRSVLDSLEETGWLSGGGFGQNQ